MYYTDIVVAAESGAVEDVQYFIEEKGVDVNIKDSDGCTPLDRAAACGNVEVVKFLVSKGADIHVTENCGFTPLHSAAYYDFDVAERVEVAKFLISKGANVEAKTYEGNTPVDLAKMANCWEMIEYLKSVGGKET
jgi:ankyrin repeat protein